MTYDQSKKKKLNLTIYYTKYLPPLGVDASVPEHECRNPTAEADQPCGWLAEALVGKLTRFP